MMSIIFLLSGFIICLVSSEAEVHLRFEYYNNPDGTLSNNHCCDGWPLRCARNGGCDYYFRVCLDEDGMPDNIRSCKYGYHRSKKVADNMKNIIFSELGETFGEVPNPIVFHIPEPVDGRNLVLKVDVKDHDRFTKSDYVDYFSNSIVFHKGIYPELHMPLEMVSRTRLLAAITIKCAPNWYGNECTVKCSPPGEDDHYYCDLWTGEKICLPDWSGEDCSSQ